MAGFSNDGMHLTAQIGLAAVEIVLVVAPAAACVEHVSCEQRLFPVRKIVASPIESRGVHIELPGRSTLPLETDRAA